jgi:hypothetical protein
LIEHDLFGKPLHTFPDHALAIRLAGPPSRHPEQLISRNPSRPDGMTLNE